MRLLVIEDHPDILANITDYLTAAGHVVDCAHNGPGGLHLALTGSYDLIVLDIMLPGMDGYQLCRSLRASGKRTPIIMLTARDTLDDRLQGLREGADDYLVKPLPWPNWRRALMPCCGAAKVFSRVCRSMIWCSISPPGRSVAPVSR